MDFPLGIICSYLCEQSDAAVVAVKEPTYKRTTFSWATALPGTGSIAAGFGSPESTVYFTDLESLDNRHPWLSRAIVLQPGEELPFEELLGPNDIVLRSASSPFTLADELQHRLMEALQWNDRMGVLLEQGCTTLDLLEASQPILHSFIALSDATFSHIAHTPGIPPLDEHSNYLIRHGCYSAETIRQARNSGALERFVAQEWVDVQNKVTDLSPYPSATYVIRQRGQYAALLTMTSTSTIDSAQAFLFQLLGKRVASCLERHWRLENPLEQKYTYFLKELLSGNLSDDAQFAERAELHNLPLEGVFEICVMDLPQKVGYANYFAKEILTSQPHCKVAVNDTQTVILLCAPDTNPGRIKAMEDEIFRLARSMSVDVGVSERFTHLRSASLALEKASIALTYGRRRSQQFTNFDGPNSDGAFIYRFRRYFPFYLCDPFARSEKFLSSFMASSHPLARLQAADEKKGTNDVEILRAYLRAEGRINVVCESMHLHRNTVNYRLGKIKEHLRMGLDNPDELMYLRALFLLMSSRDTAE